MTCQWGMFILIFDIFYALLIIFSDILYSSMMASYIVTCLCDLSPFVTSSLSPASIATLMTCHMVHLVRPACYTAVTTLPMLQLLGQYLC